MDTDKKSQALRGVVKRVSPDVLPKSGDVTFSPDYTVTSTTDGGGKVLTDVEVILCFWGTFWSTTPPPTPSRNDYEQAFQGIVTGPYLHWTQSVPRRRARHDYLQRDQRRARVRPTTTRTRTSSQCSPTASRITACPRR